MIIQQLAVFVENKTGRLASVAQVLADNNIDISALSLADTAEFGILRVIVNDTKKAQEVLREHGAIVKITDVIAIAMDDVPGGLQKILAVLSANDISVEYMYACVGKVSGKALTIFKANDALKAQDVLSKEHLGEINPADIYRI